MMPFLKEEILERMTKCHDEIKKHPFRIGFEAKYIGDYKCLLYDLTVIWCDLIWRCEQLSDVEKQRLRDFGNWIHNYRQYLRTWDHKTFPMHFFDYYEQMLQVTHDFINTGNYSTYYNLECYFYEDKRYVRSTRYEWITEEKCGFSSLILPRYMPVGVAYDLRECEIKKEICDSMSVRWSDYSLSNKETLFEFWLGETKPVLEYLNQQRKNIGFVLPLWHSLIVDVTIFDVLKG